MPIAVSRLCLFCVIVGTVKLVDIARFIFLDWINGNVRDYIQYETPKSSDGF